MFRSERAKARNYSRADIDSIKARCKGLVSRAHRFRRLRSADAHRQEEIFGPVVSIIPPFVLSTRPLHRQRCEVRVVRIHLYAQRKQRHARAPRSVNRYRLRERARPSARKPTCRLAAPKTPAMAIAKPVIAALDFYSDWKTIYIDYCDKLQRAQIDNN